MHLSSMGIVLDLIRFQKTNPERLVILRLRKRIDGQALERTSTSCSAAEDPHIHEVVDAMMPLDIFP